MNRSIALVVGVLLMLALALFIISQWNDIQTLRATLSLQDKRQQRQIAEMAGDNSRLSNILSTVRRSEVLANQTPRDLLRLRGEVARLRQENEEMRTVYLAQAEEFETLRRQTWALQPMSLRERYAYVGVNTNDIPNITWRATTNQVLAELQRVGANISTEHLEYIGQDKFIHATISLPTSNNILQLSMSFWFENGKLTTESDEPRWEHSTRQ